jgi:hypothetical protein
MVTRRLGLPVSPEGRDLKYASVSFITMDGMYAGFAGAKKPVHPLASFPEYCALQL